MSDSVQTSVRPVSEQVSLRKESSRSKTKEKLTKQEKAEGLLREREERIRMREALLKMEPNQKYTRLHMLTIVSNDMPESSKEIETARRNLGDYKLKSNPANVVPDMHRATAEKKLTQMVLLEDSKHTLKMVFNSRVHALRDLKARLVEKFRKYNEEIIEINKQLNIKERVFEVAIDEHEFPENREKISKDEVIKYEQFKQKEEQRRKRREQAKAAGVSSFPTDDDEEAPAKPKSVLSAVSKKSGGKASVKGRELTAKEKAEVERKQKMASISKSEMEILEQEMQRQKLFYEKQRIQKVIS